MRRSCLYLLRDLGFLQVDKCLICAFVERWQPDTSTFHLPIREMNITLDDISVFLHLPIVGRFFYIPNYFKIDATGASVQYLGMEYEDVGIRWRVKVCMYN